MAVDSRKLFRVVALVRVTLAKLPRATKFSRGAVFQSFGLVLWQLPDPSTGSYVDACFATVWSVDQTFFKRVEDARLRWSPRKETARVSRKEMKTSCRVSRTQYR